MSSKKKTILFFLLLFFTAVITIAIQAAVQSSTSKNDQENTAASAHDETNSDGHHNSDSEELGDVVDLTNQNEVSMDIKDFKYEKSNIKIKKGTNVTWTNQDEVQHNVMQEHENDNDAHDAPSKDEEKPDVLASRLLSRGESYSYTFNEVSTSPYHCSPHPYMKGSVTVVE
ncbi:MAG: plastocyanin/azurin family copper-binding protein [Candidatus Saccharibacteria bacterium]|nr:plastocyanin/azurin family copper-binding protein [Candidatus Saccharibacteria bacterium]